MYYTQQLKKMEYGKLAITLLNWFGIPITVLGILANLESWKAGVLFVLSAIYLLLRTIYYAVEKEQCRRKRNIELKRQQFEFDREKKNK